MKVNTQKIIYRDEQGSDRMGSCIIVYNDMTGVYREWSEEYHDFPSPNDKNESRSLKKSELLDIVRNNNLSNELSDEGLAKYRIDCPDL